MMKKELMTVVGQRRIAENIFEITIEGDLVLQMNHPGQFVHVKVSEGHDLLLRRPISICNIDKARRQFTMVYRKEGKGTTLLSEKKPGDKIDVLGPLGNGFPLERVKKGDTALLVGGGIGVPPLYELSKQLKLRGVNVIHVLGFQTEKVIFYEKEFSALGETFVATADGSYSFKGFVTDVIEQLNLQFHTLYACGPTPMLKTLQDKYQTKAGYLSLEERMGCGIGACFACVCRLQSDPDGYAYKKICSDGPVFPIGEVVL
jgi:dihydroorotate dehydrogenase electron transfer subunit